MKFKNFCLVIIGPTKDVKKEIEKISESKPNMLDGKGMLIATFTSFVDVNEISTWFTINNRNFLLFELNKETSGYFLTKPDLHNGLFGFLTENTVDLTEKTNNFLNSITSSSNISDIKFSSITTTASTVEYLISEKDIEKMTKLEKDNLYNKIIDNGIDKLTDNDKKILTLLCK